MANILTVPCLIKSMTNCLVSSRSRPINGKIDSRKSSQITNVFWCNRRNRARYCPSIEDKIVKFAEKERHQIFLEPEGIETDEIYVNGFSTCLPFEVQVDLVRTIIGCETAEILRPAYAVEYDFSHPTQLLPSLETKVCRNLFLAGQINGTSGYEEAGAQGLMAGINAARRVKNLEPIILRRNQAYIGVLIDDLITKGTTEPYRMFTSRAEYRLLLRQDNADMRLSEIGHKIGLLPERHYQKFCAKKQCC